MLSGLKKGSQPLKSDGQDMETLLQWRPLFWLEFGTSFEGLKPCRQTVSRYVYVIYIYYILYIYFDTWKILEKTSAFLEKTHPFFAAKNRVFFLPPGIRGKPPLPTSWFPPAPEEWFVPEWWKMKGSKRWCKMNRKEILGWVSMRLWSGSRSFGKVSWFFFHLLKGLGLTTYLYRGYNPLTKYHGHPSSLW